MKKVININFQGRVIPIEELAFETLKQYIESLRRHFVNEEGRDEIINDIENRIAELLEVKIKKGAPCITEDDIAEVIKSMGRPEDFDDDTESYSSNESSSTQQPKTHTHTTQTAQESRTFARAENDKVIAGVCAGLAHYLKIDPAVVRLVFALFAFGGFGTGVLIYIILWVILPGRNITQSIRKRLYRDTDSKMVAGVASGLAAYFNIETWIPRLIFVLPFFIGWIPNAFNFGWGWWGPSFVFNGLGSMLFTTYIVLWIVLPKAVSASEKLEMRGEKVDLESIKNTVQEDINSGKIKVEKAAKDFSERATKVGEEISEMAQKKAQQFSAEVTPIAKKAGTGIGNAIGVLFKAFFLFIAGTIAFSLLIALSIMLYSGIGILPLKNFILEGFWQNALTWSVLLLFIAVPVLAIIVWITRRMMRVKSGNPYLGYIFGGLWVVGLISLFVLIGMVTSNFRNRDNITETKLLEQPSNGSMMVKLSDERLRFYRNDFFDGELPFFSANHDSMLLNTVRVKVVQSEDSNYNFKLVKFSRGSSPLKAEENAQNVTFDVQQNDSVLLLPKGFPVSSKNKFRNQQVLAILEVPVGKKVMIDRSIDGYNWFDLTINRRKGWTIEWDDKWNKDFNYRFNVPYVMTSSGLQQIGKSETDSEKPADDGSFKMKIDKDGIEIETGPKDEKYRYRPRNQRKNNPEDNTPSTAPAAANSQNAKLETHIPFMLITG